MCSKGDFFLMISVIERNIWGKKRKERKEGMNHNNIKGDSEMKRMKFDFDICRQNFVGVEMKY